ncbi:hypothetical protein BD414DRAFT_569590 [Trametes punicea]|nr:hypothetical protein BD414DRAFT_569590 [Trametes punicea]
MVHILQSSRTRLARKGSRLVQGLREKSSWLVKNILKARPDVDFPRIPRRQPRRMRHYGAEAAQLCVPKQGEVPSVGPADDSSAAHASSRSPCTKTLKSIRRSKRIGGRPVDALNAVDEELESDSEDFGRPFTLADEDSSAPSEYHTAPSHFTDVSGLETIVPPILFDESSGVVFSRVCLAPDGRPLPTFGSSTGDYDASQPCVPISPMTPSSESCSAGFLDAPSLMLTLPTPQVAHSPVFVPRSPITLLNYVEATTPVRMLNPLSLPSSASMSPAPPLPSCERCCLAQLEEGIVCRACEKQWLACKMWYQAHDGGRRRWLTEPYIKPAESTASVRAVMSVLGVPGSNGGAYLHANRGLGLGSSVSFEQELPFRVLATSSNGSAPRARSGSGSGGCSNSSCAALVRTWTADAKRAALICQDSLRLDAAKKMRAALRALWAASLEFLFPVAWDVRSSVSSRSTSDDSSGASCAARIGDHQWLPSCSVSPSSGSSRMACITSNSRFVEHLS